MNRICTAALMLCLGCTAIKAQTTNEDDSYPRGEAIIQVFSNFHSGFGSRNDDRGFDLDRSYLGYQYRLTDKLTARGVMNVGKSDDVNDYHRIAYIKHAYLSYVTGRWTLNAGLISTTQFKTMERFWGYRYLYKSFQDQYKFGNSADMGVSAAWQASDLLAIDAIVVNGEGYKKLQVQDGLQYGVGLTGTPVSGLTLRVYAGLNEQQAEGARNTQNYSVFAGYRLQGFSIGAEYNYMKHAQGVEGHNLTGFSTYSTLQTGRKSKVFARYDRLSSNKRWNIEKDEDKLLLGAEWELSEYVKLAPNLRITMPRESTSGTTATAFVSCFFGL